MCKVSTYIYINTYTNIAVVGCPHPTLNTAIHAPREWYPYWRARLALTMQSIILAAALAVAVLGPLQGNYIEYEAQAKVVEPVLIEEKIEWTKERVEEEVRRVFPDAPIMVKVAFCESSFLPHAYNPTNDSHDGGVFQISEKYHGERLDELGLDPYDVRDNLTYARMLYDESGLAPWIHSKHCWSK